MRFGYAVAAFTATTVLATAFAHADEGQWLPRQIAEIHTTKNLQAAGLQLRPDEVWNANDGGTMGAIVNLSGCSAGFVSAEGLIATNHHCAYGAIQAASTVEHDYIADGFLAATRADEIVAKEKRVQIVQSVTDVTQRIHEVVAKETDPTARAKAVELVRKQLVADCEKTPDAITGAPQRCRIADFYAGSEVQLIAAIELRDVRLVYAPPSAIGEFGGEVDNWMWPRHTGDFAILRAYVGPDGKPADHAKDNVPFQPKRWLPVSTEGVGPGDFVAVLGYPGRTQRYQPAVEVARQIDQVFPARVDYFGELIGILEAAGARDARAKIAVAAKLKSLANVHKNAQGMLDGLRRNGTLGKREREDAELARWAESQSDKTKKEALARIQTLVESRRDGFARDFLLDSVGRGANALAIAVDLVRRSRERAKPDLERVTDHMDREADELWATQERRLRDYVREIDEELLRAYVRRLNALPSALRAGDFAESEVASRLKHSKIGDPAFVRKLWDADAATLERERDPIIEWARELVVAIEALEQRDLANDGEWLELGPRYFAMLEQSRGGPLYPDANGTLRFSFAKVQGYSPRDGLQALPQTTVAGLMAKHTGVEPFTLPEAVRTAAAQSTASRWADAKLGDVPVAFLSNADTTGGNSGSPVVDGRGRWIGLNFDRVWENVAGDFGYSVERSRNIVVDVRYVLWVLDEVAHADALLAELGVTKAAPTPARADAAATPATAREPASASEIGVPIGEAPPSRAAVSASCACTSGDGQPVIPALAIVVPWLVLRRRAIRA
jgi:hypothetical protein